MPRQLAPNAAPHATSDARSRREPARVGVILATSLRIGIAARAIAASRLRRWPRSCWRTARPGSALSLSLVFGALFGFVLQRSRFCFFCNFRDWFDARDPRGLLGILTALAVGFAGYTVVFGAWLPDPATGRLPPDAFIGPVSGVLVLAGLAFGAGMAISGSCISAHLYRLGEGSPTAPFALIGTALGFVLGFLTWNPLYLTSVSDCAGGLAAALARLCRRAGRSRLAMLGIALALAAAAPNEPKAHAGDRTRPWRARLRRALAGMGRRRSRSARIGIAAYLRVGPLGVTAEIGARARQAADSARSSAGCGSKGSTHCGAASRLFAMQLLTPNGLFVGGLVLASFAAALRRGSSSPACRPPSDWTRPRRRRAARLGRDDRARLHVGTLLSGIMAGAAVRLGVRHRRVHHCGRRFVHRAPFVTGPRLASTNSTHSSAEQSAGLRSRWSQVRILLGGPTSSGCRGVLAVPACLGSRRSVVQIHPL